MPLSAWAPACKIVTQRPIQSYEPASCGHQSARAYFSAARYKQLIKFGIPWKLYRPFADEKAIRLAEDRMKTASRDIIDISMNNCPFTSLGLHLTDRLNDYSIMDTFVFCHDHPRSV